MIEEEKELRSKSLLALKCNYVCHSLHIVSLFIRGVGFPFTAFTVNLSLLYFLPTARGTSRAFCVVYDKG